jgi:hypothetical protein
MENRKKIVLSLLIATIMCLGSVASFAIVSVNSSTNAKKGLTGLSQDVSQGLLTRSLGSVAIPEDNVYTMTLSDYFLEGWETMEISGNDKIAAIADDQYIYFTPQQDWYGIESIDITAYYNLTIGPVRPDPRPNWGPVPIPVDPPVFRPSVSCNLLLEVWAVNDPPTQMARIPTLDAQLGAAIPQFINLDNYFQDVDSELEYFIGNDMSFVETSLTGSVLGIEIGSSMGKQSPMQIFATDGEFTTIGVLNVDIDAASNIAFDEDTVRTQYLASLFPSSLVAVDCIGSGSLDVQLGVIGSGGWSAQISAPMNWNGAQKITLEGTLFHSIGPRPDPIDCAAIDDEALASLPAMWSKVYITLDTNVRSINDPPMLRPTLGLPLRTLEDTTLFNALDVSTLFYDVDSELTYTTASKNRLVTPSIDKANMLSAVPAQETFGNDIICVTAYDGEFSVTTELPITVGAVNDPPYANFDGLLVRTSEDVPADVNITALFGDVDSDLAYSANSSANFTVTVDQANGTATIAPAQDWNGCEMLTFHANDGESTTSSSAYIVVAPVNDPVAIVSDVPAMAFSEDGAARMNLVPYFDDVDSQIAYSVETACPGLTTSVADGVLSVSADEGWNGYGTVTVTATDGQYSVSAPMGVTVLAVNDPPVALSQIGDVAVAEDESATLELSERFADADSDLAYQVDGAIQITATIDAAGTLTISAPENWYGSESLTVTATDGEYDLSETVQVTFTPVNDAPILVSRIATASFASGESRTLDLRGSFMDPDGDAMAYAIKAPDGITASIDQVSGVALLAASANYSGTGEIVVTATDGYATTSTAADVVVTMTQKSSSAQAGLPIETGYMLGGGLMVMSVIAAVGLSMYAREAGLNNPARRRAKQTIIASA